MLLPGSASEKQKHEKGEVAKDKKKRFSPFLNAYVVKYAITCLIMSEVFFLGIKELIL